MFGLVRLVCTSIIHLVTTELYVKDRVQVVVNTLLSRVSQISCTVLGRFDG